MVSLGLLLVALVAVVGDAKTVSPTIEAGVAAANLPHAFVGVIIALLVLLPETLAAARAARRDRVQTSLNLALGSAMASIGLTIPAIAIASIWLDGPLLLGLGGTQLALLALTAVTARPHRGAGPGQRAAGRRTPGADGRLRLPGRQPVTRTPPARSVTRTARAGQAMGGGSPARRSARAFR